MRRATGVLFIFLLFSIVSASSSYENCTHLSMPPEDACATIEVTSDCMVNILLSVNNQTVLQGSVNVETSRTLCTTYRSCDLCVDINDFYSTDNDTNMCIDIYTKECELSLEEIQIFNDCFLLINSSASQCIECPNDCGGIERGHCMQGRCICEDGWALPLCMTPNNSYNETTPPNNNTQCIDLPEPLSISLCSDITINNCSIDVNTTMNGNELVSISLDLLQSEQLQASQCQEITSVGPIKCEACVAVLNLTTEYDEDLGANVFDFCLELTASHGCAQILFLSEDFEPLELGCFQILASTCHGNCSEKCSEHGECVDGVCTCEPGWSGWYCEERGCIYDCGDFGECVNGVCECFEGYFGENCSQVCDQEITGSLLQGQKHYYYEFTPESSEEPWRGFLDITRPCGALDVDIFITENATSTLETINMSVYVQQNCPPTRNQYYATFHTTFKEENRTLRLHDTFRVFQDCQEETGTWFFAVYCNNASACPFDIQVWPSWIMSAPMDVKIFGELEYPHLNYYSFTLPSYGTWSALLKIKDNGDLDDVEEYLIGFINEDSCPTATSPLVLSDPEPMESTSLYSYKYELEYTSNVNGSEWIMFLEPLIVWPDMQGLVNPLSYSLLLHQEFICYPPCLHGGQCSKEYPNTCVCTSAGYMGDRCEFPLCDPRCGPHGECVATNVCRCEAGWEGEICIDVAHETSPIPLQLLSEFNFTYLVVIVVSLLLILFSFLLLLIKIKRDNHFIRDCKELFYYVTHCCKRPSVAPSSYRMVSMESTEEIIQ